MQATDAFLELRLCAGTRQHHALDVILQVDVVGLHPGGVRQLQRHFGQLAAQHRGQGQAASVVTLHGLAEVSPVIRREFQQAQRPDVHRRCRRLQVQEDAVQAAQRLHVLRCLLLVVARIPGLDCHCCVSPPPGRGCRLDAKGEGSRGYPDTDARPDVLPDGEPGQPAARRGLADFPAAAPRRRRHRGQDRERVPAGHPGAAFQSHSHPAQGRAARVAGGRPTRRGLPLPAPDAAGAGIRCAAGRTRRRTARADARSQPSGLAGVPDRRPGTVPVRRLHQDPSLAGGRRVGHRPGASFAVPVTAGPAHPYRHRDQLCRRQPVSLPGVCCRVSSTRWRTRRAPRCRSAGDRSACSRNAWRDCVASRARRLVRLPRQ